MAANPRDHGLTVPHGWIKGEELVTICRNDRVDVMRKPSAIVSYGSFDERDVAVISFRTLVGYHLFWFWWYGI